MTSTEFYEKSRNQLVFIGDAEMVETNGLRGREKVFEEIR